MGGTAKIVSICAAMIALSSCAGSSQPAATEGTPSATVDDSGSPRSGDVAAAALLAQLDTIEAAIAAWRVASSVAQAQAAAETATNLVVGPNGPGYGDRDGDGIVGGSTGRGVLPGIDGSPLGLASDVATVGCVDRDVLGGPWTDPGARWNEMLSAIDRWRPDRNTMPSLASHPMRIVGWASFSMESDSLIEIRSFAGHANIHINISLRALDC